MKIRNLTISIVCLVMVLISAGQAGAYPEILWPTNGHFYRLYTWNESWTDADDYCEDENGPAGFDGDGYLVTITSHDENDLVEWLMNGSTNVAWIGATDSASEGIWRWEGDNSPEDNLVFWDNGVSIGYEDWGSGEPNNYGDEDYACIQSVYSHYHSYVLWNDESNDGAGSGYYFICEWDPEQVHTITVSAGANGSIEPMGTPPGQVNVTPGDDQTFTVSPDAGYQVATVLVNGAPASLDGNNQYTFAAVSADQSFEVSFALIAHTITATAGPNGSISPSGAVAVADGAEKTFTFTSDPGYGIDRVLVNGLPVTISLGQYQFVNVTANQTIHVDFVPVVEDPVTVAGCGTSTATDFSATVGAEDYSRINISVENGNLVLDTGNRAVDPDNIVVPVTQDLYVTFIYERAGFRNTDFGWMLAGEEGVGGTKHEIYQDINDNNNNGVLDNGPYDDGNKHEDYNGDGVVNALDNQVFLGTFEAGTEIVFYLKVDNVNKTFYSKSAWNSDVYVPDVGGGRVIRPVLLKNTGWASLMFPRGELPIVRWNKTGWMRTP